MAGVLHLPVPLRRLPLRDHHRASQRDRHAHDNEEEGPGRETGNLSVSESQASTCAARFKPHRSLDSFPVTEFEASDEYAPGRPQA